MDNRLFQIWRLRPVNLRKGDLPEAARAIVSLYRKKAQVTTGVTKNVPYVLITGTGLKVQILAEDWARILPYIKDGSFEQPGQRSAQASHVEDPKTSCVLDTLDSVDRPLYWRVLQILQSVFTNP